MLGSLFLSGGSVTTFSGSGDGLSAVAISSVITPSLSSYIRNTEHWPVNKYPSLGLMGMLPFSSNKLWAQRNTWRDHTHNTCPLSFLYRLPLQWRLWRRLSCIITVAWKQPSSNAGLIIIITLLGLAVFTDVAVKTGIPGCGSIRGALYPFLYISSHYLRTRDFPLPPRVGSHYHILLVKFPI